MALPSSLVRNVRSKEARRALSGAVGDDLVQWVTVTPSDSAAARDLVASGVLDADTEVGADDDAARCASNVLRGEEFERLFWPERLSPSNCELGAAAAVALLRCFALSASDRFLDLGCARGRVVLAAFGTTACARCAGVELSPSDHALASAARRRCLARCAVGSGGESGAAARRLPPFHCGDLRAHPALREYSVLYCAIRGDASRPVVMADLLDRLLVDPPRAAGAPPTRLILAGFGLDVKGTAHEGRVRLARAYALRAPDAAALALYGAKEGPRVLLEYEVG
jgi:hypothetical protein